MHAPVWQHVMMQCVGIAKNGYLLAQLHFLASQAVRRTFLNHIHITYLRLRVLAEGSPAHEAPRTD